MRNFLDLIFQAVSPICSQHIHLQLWVALSLIILPTVIPKELLISQLWNLSLNCYSTVCVIKNASLVEATLTGIYMGHTIEENLHGISYCNCRNFDSFIGSEVLLNRYKMPCPDPSLWISLFWWRNLSYCSDWWVWMVIILISAKKNTNGSVIWQVRIGFFWYILNENEIMYLWT